MAFVKIIESFYQIEIIGILLVIKIASVEYLQEL